tara:strand:+ start:16 stop:126 length:111 start_codon:yes stop_codon:yes gene_type:complete
MVTFLTTPEDWAKAPGVDGKMQNPQTIKDSVKNLMK